MARRVWIVAKKEKLSSADLKNAVKNNCPEIANGIPPAFMGIVLESDLPCAYEEPEPVFTPTRDLVAELAQVQLDIQAIKTKVGME